MAIYADTYILGKGSYENIWGGAVGYRFMMNTVS